MIDSSTEFINLAFIKSRIYYNFNANIIINLEMSISINFNSKDLYLLNMTTHQN
jgi:hypothetical protein